MAHRLQLYSCNHNLLMMKRIEIYHTHSRYVDMSASNRPFSVKTSTWSCSISFNALLNHCEYDRRLLTKADTTQCHSIPVWYRDLWSTHCRNIMLKHSTLSSGIQTQRLFVRVHNVQRPYHSSTNPACSSLDSQTAESGSHPQPTLEQWWQGTTL